MNYAESNGFVYGKIKKTKDGTYHVLYLSPEGYFNPVKSIGEYATKKDAEQKLDQYHEYMTNCRKEAKEFIRKDHYRSELLYKFILILLIVSAIAFTLMIWSCHG